MAVTIDKILGKPLLHNHKDYVIGADIQRFGFLNQTETSISFNDSTYLFTLTSVGSTWSYYRSGTKYTISGNKTVKIADSPVNGTLYYIFIDATTGALTASTSAWTLNDTKVPVATVYWDATLTPKYVLSEERHTCLIDRVIHRYEHESEGTKIISGGTIDDYASQPSSPADDDNTFSIAQTVIADEDIFQTLTAVSDGDGTANNYYVAYRSGSGYKWAASPVPFLYTASGYIQYDSSGTMTEGASGNFYNYYLGACNIQGDLKFFMIPGRSAHATASSAYGESVGSFVFTNFITNEAVFLYQITFGTLAAYTTKGKCRIQRVAAITSNIITTTVSASVNHNTLGGIQGGTSGEYYHLTATEYSALGGADFNVDGGAADTNYGAIAAIDGGTA